MTYVIKAFAQDISKYEDIEFERVIRDAIGELRRLLVSPEKADCQLWLHVWWYVYRKAEIDVIVLDVEMRARHWPSNTGSIWRRHFTDGMKTSGVQGVPIHHDIGECAVSACHSERGLGARSKHDIPVCNPRLMQERKAL